MAELSDQVRCKQELLPRNAGLEGLMMLQRQSICQAPSESVKIERRRDRSFTQNYRGHIVFMITFQ
jgi:hypothetical protein